jgi:cyanophycinase
MPPERPPGPGPLVAVGGAEDKIGRRAVLRRFVQAAAAHAGPDRAPRIVVVPTASSLGPEVVDVYAAAFQAAGAGPVVGVRPRDRAEAADADVVAALAGADGIFLSGGNQLKLSAVVSGTPFGAALARAHEAGVAVGGTSAGASVLSEHMIAFGTGGATPKQRMSQLAAGLGLVRGVVIDQHFEQRNRYGRLLSLVAQSPSLLGIGIDEDTAAVISGGRFLEVAGRGAVTVFDASAARSNAYEARRTAPLLVSGAVVHVLPDTACFDLTMRRLVGFGQPPAAPEVAALEAEEAELAAAELADAELRHVARRISAEGADPHAPERSDHRAERRAQRHGRPAAADGGPPGRAEGTEQ